MKKLGEIFLRNLFIGLSIGFGLFISGFVVVYASSIITTLGGNNIESGDKIGSGWYQEVDNNLSNIVDWVNNKGATESYVDSNTSNASLGNTYTTSRRYNGSMKSCADGYVVVGVAVRQSNSAHKLRCRKLVNN